MVCKPLAYVIIQPLPYATEVQTREIKSVSDLEEDALVRYSLCPILEHRRTYQRPT